ncbi:MAG: class I SAM-dependent methyltransferase [Candidatus Thorarchaeota archaeon]|nr:class I SAM-dependent methyltransferase [Candidatus Thorarchaeota archaeon]
MASKARAWRELMKVGINVSKIRKDVDAYYRGNVIRVLRDEGWFEYLLRPRTIDDMLSHFGYSDPEFLDYLLGILVEDGILHQVDGNRYQSEEHIEDGWVLPAPFKGTMDDLWQDHARAIPDRLRGRPLTFTGGMNLFNWDDALSSQLYEQIRRTAFALTNAWNKPGAFLDVGSGTGWGTAAIWTYYYTRGHMYEGSPFRIVGIEPNDRLLTIARDEFPNMIKTHLGSKGNHSNYPEMLEKFPPEFKHGFAESIPFEDETFDYVYSSMVLHWTDPKSALKEMLRVTKPGGIVFGTENFYPGANKFCEIHIKVVEGAYGHFHVDDFRQWAKELGAKKIRLATPLSAFEVIK